MAVNFQIGDLIWARMKGFPAWPGKVMEPPQGEKRQKKTYVFFYGSNNFAWVADDLIWLYVENKEKFSKPRTTGMPRGFQDALDAIEEEVKRNPPVARPQSSQPASPSSTSSVNKVKELTPSSGKVKEGKKVSTPDRPKSAQKDDSSLTGDDKSEDKIKRQERKKTPKTDTSGTEKKSLKRAGEMLKSPPAKTRLLAKDTVTVGPSDVAAQSSTSRRSGGDDAHSATSSVKRLMTAAVGGDGDARYHMSGTDHPYLPDVLSETVSAKNIIATPMKIGFLGLGIMGSGMVNNLLRSGHEVTVWNRTTAKVRDFVKDGALKASSPADVVQSCDITFSCVTDPTALKDLVFGNCGVLQGIGPGKGYVDMSTVDVETITDVCEAITSRGGRFLEAPVIGSRQPAEEGQLIILAAGDRTLYEDCFSCFQAMGRHMFFLGEIGFGARMKLVVNLLIGTTLAGLAESLALAEKVGLDKDEVLQILSFSPVNSALIRGKGADMALSRYNDPACKLQVMQTDLRLAINMSDIVDQPLHVGAAVNELYKKAKAKGYGEHDVAAIYRAADL